MRKLEWQKEFVVYHIKSKAFRKAFDLLSGAKRSATCVNRRVGVTAYAVMPWNAYWQMVKI